VRQDTHVEGDRLWSRGLTCHCGFNLSSTGDRLYLGCRAFNNQSIGSGRRFEPLGGLLCLLALGGLGRVLRPAVMLATASAEKAYYAGDLLGAAIGVLIMGYLGYVLVRDAMRVWKSSGAVTVRTEPISAERQSEDQPG
jgi:hypothetical protein